MVELKGSLTGANEENCVCEKGWDIEEDAIPAEEVPATEMELLWGAATEEEEEEEDKADREEREWGFVWGAIQASLVSASIIIASPATPLAEDDSCASDEADRADKGDARETDAEEEEEPEEEEGVEE